jgi:predicted RNase H-like HicB family nuclease
MRISAFYGRQPLPHLPGAGGSGLTKLEQAMARRGFDKRVLLRLVEGLEPYPAVLRPAPEGGFEVIITNFPGVNSYGVKRETALLAGEELLTAHIYFLLRQADKPPAPSDPQRLIPDEDDPPGTEMVMLEPDKKVLGKWLGLVKKEREGALKSLGIYGRKPRK